MAETKQTTFSKRQQRAHDEDIVVTDIQQGGALLEVTNYEHDEPSSYVVDVRGSPPRARRCSCPDHQFRNAYCKHCEAVDCFLADDPDFDGGAWQ